MAFGVFRYVLLMQLVLVCVLPIFLLILTNSNRISQDEFIVFLPTKDVVAALKNL